jgi:hypothetical protein
MLREPRPNVQPVQVRKDARTNRLRVVKLEERIAPTCHTNPHGKEVGSCKGGKA